MSTTIESLGIEISSDSSAAITGLDALSSTLSKLKTSVKGGIGLTTVSKQIANLTSSLGTLKSNDVYNLDKLSQGLEKLNAISNLKISSSIATQITGIGSAIKTLKNVDFTVLRTLPSVLAPLSTLGKTNLSSFITQLNKLPQAAQALNGVDLTTLNTKLKELVSALAPLSSMGKNNLTSFITQLNKLPELMKNLKSLDMRTLYNQIQSLTRVFQPLATEMQKVANGFAAFPTRIQRLISSNQQLSTSNTKTSLSYVNLAAKIGVVVWAVRRVTSILSSWITESTTYIESLNLFTVSMGEFADEAKAYAESVSEIMGIDPSTWLRNQGIFMTLATGLGVASDRAYIMSQNLTQLGYDLSSFFNISYEDAFQKLQSGLAGELEPLRRLGYDLSVARLQQEALNLGITKSVNAMTQAEKAELRYYAMLTQVTTAQGDMARTLNAPANQLRILQAQVTQCARSLGNIFIPVLNAVLPYAIALAKALRMVANIIAGLFGFVLPEIDYSGVGDMASGVGDMASGVGDVSDELDNAGSKAKELKNALLGIDELNVISPEDSSGSGGGSDIGGAGGLGFELPTYDFLGDALNSRVAEILEGFKEWLGITEDIDTWSEFFHTRLGRILTTVGAIGLGLLAWKLSSGLLSGFETFMSMKKLGLDKPLLISAGISLAITGIALEAAGIYDAIQNELNSMNFTQILGGGGFITAGGALIGKALGSAVIGSGVGAIVAGLPMFFVGIYDAVKNGLNWLNGLIIPLGATTTGAGIGAIIGALGGPIGAGIGALIGVAVGLITDGIIAIVQHWDEITEFLSTLFTKTIPTLFKKFVAWLGKIPKKIKAIFEALPGEISEWFDKLWQPIKDYDWNALGYNMGQWFGNAWKKAVEFVTVTIPEWFEKMWKSIKNAFKQFFTVTLPYFFTTVIPDVVSKVGEFFKKLPSEIYNAFVSAIKWIKDIGVAIIDGIWEGLQTVWKAITDFVDGFIQGFKDALGIHSPSTVFAEIGRNIVAGLLQGIENFTDMLGTVSKWASSVVEWFSKGQDGRGIVENFKLLGSNIISGFKEKIGTTYTTTKDNITTWASNVKSWFGDNASYSSFSAKASDVINGFKDKIGSYYSTTKTNITTWASNVKSWFSSNATYSSFSTYASDVINGFKDKIGSYYSTTKTNITTWASNVKSWFGDNASYSSFSAKASDVINGFKDKIGSYYSTTKTNITTWASNVKSWFSSNVSYSSFYTLASNVVSGFKDGIGNLYGTCKSTITSWGSSIISWFKDKLDIHSPSRVFATMGEYSIMGYNQGLQAMGNTTKGIVNKWTDSFTNSTPTMGFAVDTSALKHYDSDSFVKSVSSDITASNSVSVNDSFSKAMLREAVLEALNASAMAIDVKRQADKNETTVVKVGNRTITDAVTTQEKANGFKFVTT